MTSAEPFNCPQKKDDIEFHCFQSLDRYGSGAAESIAAGLRYALNVNADVLNMSLGIHFETPIDRARYEKWLNAYGVDKLGRELYEKGCLIFSSAGNEDTRNDWQHDDMNLPAIYPWAIGIGSLTDDGRKSNFSSDGPELEFTADGENLYGIRGSHGTSWASPFVAGIAAYLKTYYWGQGGSPDFFNYAEFMRRDLRYFAVHGGKHSQKAWCRDHGFGSLTPFGRQMLAHVRNLRISKGYEDPINLLA